MEDTNPSSTPSTWRPQSTETVKRRSNRRRLRITLWSVLAASLILGSTAWLGVKAMTLMTELSAASNLLPTLKNDILRSDPASAEKTVGQLKAHTATAREAGRDPLWTAARAIPWLGATFEAASEVATSADDVARLGAVPLVSVFQSLDWRTLTPNTDGVDLGPLQIAEPKIASAANAVRQSSERLNQIDSSALLPQIAEPLTRAREQLSSLRDDLDTAADLASVAPSMMGGAAPRNYLLLIQNNAEIRATGGIPGALAVLTLDNGKMSLSGQSSAGDVGVMSPILPVDAEQQQIYSPRLGTYMQDVNLTPDFPTAASTARAMWERKWGQQLDGVISIDPVALGYVLEATGPVTINDPELVALARAGLPTELNGNNVVPTLLSDVYAEISRPQLQDVYFAGVAREIFSALSSGKGDANGLIEGMSRGAAEGRVLVWSGASDEQAIIGRYPLSGSIAGPSISPAQFGVYFNDGTGAKMDYHVKRTVQLVKMCAVDGYEQTAVRITSTNTAPEDAATSLPLYVTAGGAFGVPTGSVQTNVIAYGPVQANVETATVDGKKTDFAAHHHANRPVGTVTVTLAPGQSSTVELTFGKIVQHTEPNVVVTPTVQPVKDVILATENAACNQ